LQRLADCFTIPVRFSSRRAAPQRVGQKRIIRNEVNTMAKFTIQPHGRLQEWIAHEKGYFRDEGLDYEFLPGPSAHSKKQVDASGSALNYAASVAA
jgi:ABC-type nitrate/sulfonate/bicarbonate transport system substrate-binding protein